MLDIIIFINSLLLSLYTYILVYTYYLPTIFIVHLFIINSYIPTYYSTTIFIA